MPRRRTKKQRKAAEEEPAEPPTAAGDELLGDSTASSGELKAVEDTTKQDGIMDGVGSDTRLMKQKSVDEDDDGYIKVQPESPRKVPRKRIFRQKDSVLTELSRTNKHFQSLYHVFIIMMIHSIAYSMLKDSVEAGTWHIDISYYTSGFGPLQKQLRAVVNWVPLQIAAFLIYPMFKLWSWLHGSLGRLADFLFVCLLGVYYMIAHVAVVTSIVTFDLPPIPSLVLAIEQLRFSLKSYSFIRENAYKVLHPWHKDDTTGPSVWYQGQMEPQVGSFSQYTYFLFCPTLLYRDKYPLIPRVRISRVIAHLVKCIISVTFLTIVCKEVFGGHENNPNFLAINFLTCLLFGLLLQFMSGYFFLHSWSNLFGELLRFADREFYSDWWNCTSFAGFYRKWNLLVHDWIKEYVYQDLIILLKSKRYAVVATMPAIIMSAVYHEYVLWSGLRFVMPILLFQYAFFGIPFYFVRSKKQDWNYFVHWGLHTGCSIMIFCYATEFYARTVCVKEENLVNTFVPRFYECFFA